MSTIKQEIRRVQASISASSPKISATQLKNKIAFSKTATKYTTHEDDDDDDLEIVIVKPHGNTTGSATIASTTTKTDNQMTIEEDQKTVQQSYGNQLEFLLTLIGYSVGYGNIWRFPFLVMQNGGGAFLVPYGILMLLVGISLYVLEQAVGQFSAASALRMWEFAPIFCGLGACFVVLSLALLSYYGMILAWCVYYLSQTFNWMGGATFNKLVWSRCDGWWNRPGCYETHASSATTTQPALSAATVMVVKNASSAVASSMASKTLATGAGVVGPIVAQSAGEQFWMYNVLEQTSSVLEPGGLNWKIVLCFVIAWTLTYACVSMGIKSSGKVVYVTATAPYVLLTILAIRVCPLEGAIDGLKFLFQPEWDQLLSSHIWSQAAIQVFYTLGVGWGPIVTMSAFNKFHSNFLSHSITVPVVGGFTSILGSIVVFSVAGHMVYQKNKCTPSMLLSPTVNNTMMMPQSNVTWPGIDDSFMNMTSSAITAAAGINMTTNCSAANHTVKSLIRSGHGLIFIVYPEALSYLPAPAVWSVLFFLMMISVGLDSMFATVEIITATLIHEIKLLKRRRRLSTLAICCLIMLLGLPCCLRGGIYIFKLIDNFCSVITVFVTVFLELISVVFFYNLKRMLLHIDMMRGKPLARPLKICIGVCWAILCPLLVLYLSIRTWTTLEMPMMNSLTKTPYPRSMIAFSVFIAAIPILPLPITALYNAYKYRSNPRQLIQATRFWKNIERSRIMQVEKDQTDATFTMSDLLVPDAASHKKHVTTIVSRQKQTGKNIEVADAEHVVQKKTAPPSYLDAKQLSADNSSLPVVNKDASPRHHINNENDNINKL